MDNLDELKSSFLQLIGNVDDEKSLDCFLNWIRDIPTSQERKDEESRRVFHDIIKDLKKSLNLNATLPSESILYSGTVNDDCQPINTVHVDSFLFSDSEVEDLCEGGLIQRNYCIKCYGTDIGQLNFISHSCSPMQLNYIFRTALPDLSGMCVVDIGSRIGAVLYGAYHFSSARSIVGIEMNSDLCQIQNSIIEKYKMQDRVRIECGDVMNFSDILKSANVIIMNNVFEFFLTTEQQKTIWKFISSTVRQSGCLFVTNPGLKTSLKPLGLEGLLHDWVEEVEVNSKHIPDDSCDIKLYKVV